MEKQLHLFSFCCQDWKEQIFGKPLGEGIKNIYTFWLRIGWENQSEKKYIYIYIHFDTIIKCLNIYLKEILINICKYLSKVLTILIENTEKLNF